jgi:hypothetical protein
LGSSFTNYSSGKRFGDDLFLPASGSRDYLDGRSGGHGNNGTYWSRLNISDTYAWVLYFGSNTTWIDSGFRTYGFAVRCIEHQGLITQLNCSDSVVLGGSIVLKSPVSIDVELSYIGGNGGGYKEQVIASEGVTGLTAIIPSGIFAIDEGVLNLHITGTPTRAGTASFAISLRRPVMYADISR